MLGNSNLDGCSSTFTLLNDSGTALTSADVLKPVRCKAANTKMATLCADGDRVFYILENVDANAAVVTVGRNKVYEGVKTSGTAPDPTSATPFVDADGAGGVSGTTSPTNAVVLAYDSAAATCTILVM